MVSLDIEIVIVMFVFQAHDSNVTGISIHATGVVTCFVLWDVSVMCLCV